MSAGDSGDVTRRRSTGWWTRRCLSAPSGVAWTEGLAPRKMMVGRVWLGGNFLRGLVGVMWSFLFCLVVRGSLILRVRKRGEFP